MRKNVKYLIISALFFIMFCGTFTEANAASTPKLHKASVLKGKKTSLEITGLDTSLYPESSLRWKSSNKKVATVSSDGVVNAKKNGKTTITVSVENTNIKMSASVKVVSFFRVKSVKIEDKPTESVVKDTKFRLHAEVSPSQARYDKILWTSSKPKVATVSSKGVFSTHKKGTTVIKAVVNGTKKKTSFKLRVINPVKLKKIEITGSNEVYVGSQIDLAANLSPSNTTFDDIQWKSSKKSVATVDENGVVTAHKAGTVKITAREKECKKKAIYTVTVKNVPVTSLSFDSHNVRAMNVGDKKTLSVTVAPANATIKTVKWKSSNSSAASVDSNGVVTALRPIESVDITATSKDNPAISCTWNIKINLTGGYVNKKTLDSIDLTVIDKLMIVAHPDDETLWGSAHLQDDEYFVVCLTHGWNERRRSAFENAMRTTNDKYLILNYPDTKKYLGNGKYETDMLTTCRSAMQKDIDTLLTYKKWNTVVTHNPFGEYGKYLHQQISKMVTTSYQKAKLSSANLWYFGRYYNKGNVVGEQISAQHLAVKQKLIQNYYSTAKGAIDAFGHMIPYENWILASEW